MKIGDENKTSDGRQIGHAFGWLGEYSLAGIYLDNTNKETYSEEWIETDQDSYVEVIEFALRYKILVDIFQNQPCCDLFLLYLKQWLQDNIIDDTYKKQLEDWYFSENCGYEILQE